MGFLSFIAVTSQISQNKSLSSLTIHMEQAGRRDTDGIVFVDVRPALVLPSPACETCREAEAMGKALQKEENERMVWFPPSVRHADTQDALGCLQLQSFPARL